LPGFSLDKISKFTLPRGFGAGALKRNGWIAAGIVFLFALVIRLIYLQQISSSPFFNFPIIDAFYHDRWAAQIAAGDWWGKEVFFKAPLYSYFLSLIYLIFWHNYYLVAAAQFIIGAFSCVLIFLIAKEIFNETAGLLAGLLASIYGIFIYFEGQLLAPSLIVFLDLLLILLLLKFKEKPALHKWFIAGMVLGISALARANILIFIPFVLVWLWLTFFKEKGKLVVVAYTVFFCLGVFSIVALVTLRNYAVGDDFVLISSNAGINFYTGNNSQSDGISAIPTGVEWERLQRLPLKEGITKPSEASRFWLARGFKFISEEPFAWFRLLLKKTYFFWNGFEPRNNISFYFFKRYSALLRIPLLGFGVVCPLALTGIILSLRCWKKTILLLLFIFSYMLSVIFFFVCSRYRVPVIPFLIIFAAYLFYWWFKEIAGRRYKSVFLSLLPLILFAAIINSNIYGQELNYSRERFFLGNIYSKRNMVAQAIAEYQKGIRLSSEDPDIRLCLGFCYERKGKLKEAMAQYKKAVKIAPDSADARNNLGTCYKRMGMLEEATKKFEEALKIDSRKPWIHNNLGICYEQLGRTQDAAKEYGLAITVEPGFAEGYHNLGLLQWKKNDDLDGAIRLFKRALILQPDNKIYLDSFFGAYKERR